MAQANFSYGGDQYVVVTDTNPPTLWKSTSQGPQLIPQPDEGLARQAAQAYQTVAPRSAQQAAGGPSEATGFPANPVAGTATQPVFQGSNPDLGVYQPRTAAQAAGGGGNPTSFPTITNPVAGTATQPVFQSNTPTAPNQPRTAAQVAGGNASPTGWPSLSWPNVQMPNVQLPNVSNPLAGTATQPVFQTSNPNAANTGGTARTASQVASSGTGGGGGGGQSATTQPAASSAQGGGTKWVPDPSLLVGGYFVDSNGTPLPPAPGQQVLDKSGQPVKWNGSGFERDTSQPANTNQGGIYKPEPTAAAPAKAAPDLSAEQARILGGVGRGGWGVTGVTDEIKARTDPTTQQTTYAPTGNKVWAITGPGGKNDTMTVAPDPNNPGGWVVAEPPKNLPDDRPKQLGDANTGYYIWDDATGGWKLAVPPKTPNADDEIKKAVDRQVAEGDRNARQRNLDKLGIYGTDTEIANIQHQAAADKLGQDQLAQRIVEFNRTQQLADQKQATDDKVAAQNILESQARTTGIGATTANTQATTQRTTALLPGEIEQQKATLAGTNATTGQTLQATQIAGAPQLKGTVGGAPVLTVVNPVTGQIDQSQADLAFQPKTQADIAARAGQIHNQMQLKSQQVQDKVGQIIGGKQFTPDDALKEFNTWYDAQVAPQAAQLAAAQDEAAFQRGKDQAAMRTSAFTAANAASTSAINAFNALKGAHPVENPAAFNSAVADLAKGKVPSNLAEATTWHGPNPIALSQAATMNALKYIDPTAAAANGLPAPNYQQMDIGAMTRNPYAPPGVQSAPGSPGAAGGGLQNADFRYGRDQPAMVNGSLNPAVVQNADFRYGRDTVPGMAAQMVPMGAQAAPGAQPAPASPATVAGSPDWWNGVMNRQAADVQLQRQQASAMPMKTPPGMFNPAYQAMYGSAVGQPATGPIAGDPTSMMPDWLKTGGSPPPDNLPTTQPTQTPRPTLTDDGTPTGRPIIGEGPANWWQRFISPFQQ